MLPSFDISAMLDKSSATRPSSYRTHAGAEFGGAHTRSSRLATRSASCWLIGALATLYMLAVSQDPLRRSELRALLALFFVGARHTRLLGRLGSVAGSARKGYCGCGAAAAGSPTRIFTASAAAAGDPAGMDAGGSSGVGGAEESLVRGVLSVDRLGLFGEIGSKENATGMRGSSSPDDDFSLAGVGKRDTGLIISAISRL